MFKVTDETNRTWYKLNDDSRLRMADDLDIAPDGKIYFSDCTTRYEMTTNTLDILEARPNGRLVCYDPATKTTQTVINHFYFPNGICVSHDGKSVLIASTSLCKIFRYWLEGPKKGQTEVLIDELPGNPDNINRASDGTYWLALVGIRTPTFDLAARKPGFRLRMVKQVPTDEWLAPALNHGCVLKFNEAGEALESWWDPTGISHSTLTSMREHKGYLYLGGLENNRIGRIKLDGVDETWTGYDAYWGAKSRVSEVAAVGMFDHLLRDIRSVVDPRRRAERHSAARRRAQPERPARCLRADRRSPARSRRRRRRQATAASTSRPARQVLKLSGEGLATRSTRCRVRRRRRRACDPSRRPPAGLRRRPRPRGDRSGTAQSRAGSKRPTAARLPG